MGQDEDNSAGVPEHLVDLFWEYDVSTLDWDEHREFIARRVLSHGNWEQICWLRAKLGDDALRRIIRKSEGKELSPRQLRLWELLLELPTQEVDRWLRDSSRKVWDHRRQP